MKQLTAKDYKEYLKKKEEGATDFTLCTFLISRFYGIPYSDVMAIPFSELFEMLAVVKGYVNSDMRQRKEIKEKIENEKDTNTNRFQLLDLDE